MTQMISSAFQAQQKHKYTLRNSNAAQRIDKLKTLKAAIESYEEKIYAALQSDLRKNRFESTTTELLFIYSELNFAIKNLAGWMKPKRAGKSMGSFFARNRICYEPKGCCLIIAPWNYPFQLLIGPLISAIAAGNCAILKPSELSPASTAVIVQLIRDCFDEREVCCIAGDATTATALLSLPFDHIFFTGSTEIGKVVMQAAAKNLSSVTLELGGKSPVIIDETANLKKAAEKIAWGKLINAGQTCIAPDYILIPRDLQQAFTEHYTVAVRRLFFKNGKLDTDVYGKIISPKHFQRISALIADALDKGAITVLGGEKEESSQTIYPTVLARIPVGTAIMKEEIFGPVLPLIAYQTLSEALNYVNFKSKPLALYIFSADKKNIQYLLKNTSSGGACVNDVLIHISNPKLPFGGVNGSGMGSAHGFFGYKAFSHERALVYQSAIPTTSLIYPPYENKAGLLKWLKKLL